MRTSASAIALAASMVAAGAAAAQTAPQDENRGEIAPQPQPGDPQADQPASQGAQIVVTGRTTRSVVTLQHDEIQKILPGVSPLRAIETLPGVTYLTADPWGNNEQNISLFIHGFNQQQLGYTLDGVPLGDQQYGNYNGLSPQRAVISEDVGSVTLATGAGDLGTASTSNLGGTIDTFTSDPRPTRGVSVEQVFGSYDALRSYARIDTGTFGGGNSAYISGVRQDARAWDFNGHQGGYQADAKFVHDDPRGKLTMFVSFSDKREPNEDATVITPANRATAPYVRPFGYPNFGAYESYLNSPAYAAAGSNYDNYYSDAQRTDVLTYAKYDWRLADHVTWSNQLYYHHDDGAGVVAGPITAAGLPGLFSFYFPGTGSATSAANLARLSAIFGGSGLASRTTEYRIDRGGVLSTLRATLGDHEIEIGGWYERQSSSSIRRWYGLDVNHPSSPYTRPLDYEDPLITQYHSEVRVNEVQAHIQDAWHVTPALTLLAGSKGTLQDASQRVPVQPIPGSFTGSRELPTGKLHTLRAFLPEIGATWNAGGGVQVFANAQKNVRQFQTSAAAGLSPFALGSQTLFDFFKADTRPETSWTYEGGVRVHADLGGGVGFQGQASYYHVDFSNRLLAISPTTTITAIVSGATILQNVGSVTTNGVDVAGTLRFGPHFSIYDGVSYNDSTFDDNYATGTATVLTRGKKVPGSPDWLNKTVVSADFAPVEVQLIGDYLGGRFATYTNDLSAPAYFTASARVAVHLSIGERYGLKNATLALNITNLTDEKNASTLSIGAASGTFNEFPLPPRQYFGTISFGF